MKYQEFKEIQQTKSKGSYKRGGLTNQCSGGLDQSDFDEQLCSRPPTNNSSNTHSKNGNRQSNGDGSCVAPAQSRQGSEGWTQGGREADVPLEKKPVAPSSALVSGGGGGGRGAGGASSGIGDIAAAALAARRDKRIDTVVLAKCRRKSQTMWPARLCSKREVRMNGLSGEGH